MAAVGVQQQRAFKVSPSPISLVRLEPRRVKMNSSTRKEIVAESVQTPTNEDPLRILAPAQKKLTTIESQRVLAVMDDAIKRLEGVVIMPTLVNSLQRYSVSLGTELVSLLEEYSQMVLDYNRLYRKLELTGSVPNLEARPSYVESEDNILFGDSFRSPSSSVSSMHSDGSSRAGRPVRLEPLSPQQEDDTNLEEKFQHTRLCLRHTVKCILRALARNPSSSSVVQAASNERPRNARRLLESMGDLRGVLQEKLLTSQVEVTKRDDHLKQVAERQKMAEEQIVKLEAELAEAQKQRNEEVTQKNSEIKRLKTNIKTVINLAEDANRRVKSEAHNQQSMNQKSHEVRQTKLQEDTTNLRKKLVELQEENKEKEQTLRKRAFNRENELENWIQKYDNEVGDRQDEIEQLDEEFTEEKAQLKELEERLGILTIEYDAVIKEQEEARQRAEEASRKMTEMARAARAIQRVWRAYRERKRALKEQQKGKKGKGKGKKGKGKGKKKK